MEGLTADDQPRNLSVEFNEEPSWLRQRVLSMGSKAGAGILAMSAVITGAVTETNFATASADEVACSAPGIACSWGDGQFELGNSADGAPNMYAKDIPGLRGVNSMADGDYGAVVASQVDGTVWQWGNSVGSSIPMLLSKAT